MLTSGLGVNTKKNLILGWECSYMLELLPIPGFEPQHWKNRIFSIINILMSTRSKGTSGYFFFPILYTQEQHNRVTENVLVLIQNAHLYK